MILGCLLFFLAHRCQARAPTQLAEAPAAPVGGKDRPSSRASVAGRPYQVGYRRETFRFVTDSGDRRARQLDLWYPTDEREQRHSYRGQIGFAAEGAAVARGLHPLLVFSHGYLLGVSDQSIFLTEGLARAGYVVASMNHADSLANLDQRKKEQPNFADVARWNDTRFHDRREDIVALLDEMLRRNRTPGSPWEGRLDPAAIGGTGHSLGGYTIMGLAGGWPSWRDPRLKAAVLYSPYVPPFDRSGDLAHVTIPVQMQGGTLDWGITPFLLPVYRKLAGPKVLLVLKHENHLGWTGLASFNKTTTECVAQGNPELMLRYTVAFFDRYLLAQDRSEILAKGDARLDSYRYEEPKK